MESLNIFFYILILISVLTDLYDRFVYTFISYIAFLVGIFIGFFNNSWSGLCEYSLQGLFGFALFAVLYYVVFFLKKREGIGFGDADFMLGLSTQLTYGETIKVLVYAAYISSFVGILYALVKNKKIKNIELPLVPFLFLGYLVIELEIDFFIQNFILK